MRLATAFRAIERGMLAGGLLLAFAAPSALAQNTWYPAQPLYSQPPACLPGMPAPQTVTPLVPPATNPAAPPSTQPTTPSPLQSSTPEQTPSFGDSSLAMSGGDVSGPAGGYIDPAMPWTHFRLRYDSAWNNNRPDRAEYFYPKCGCFRMANPPDPNAPGPPLPEKSVDYQDIDAYFEYAFNQKFSSFIEVPYRFLNPEVNANVSNFSDLKFGGKYAFIADPQCGQFLTTQLKAYMPTGNASEGLGTNHVSIEPGVLYFQKLTDRLYLESEVLLWIPVGGTDFQGNVFQYGVGFDYWAITRERFRVAPVLEFVGWTVLNGKESDAVLPTKSAGGDTIINAKLGARVGFGELSLPLNLSPVDLYVGYGRALTGAVWYEDIFRAELRFNF